ncbi:nuclear transport factor 2 family protein [Cronobacter muytjensii]|nr:ester cyclase [Cronobacter muytjensii]
MKKAIAGVLMAASLLIANDALAHVPARQGAVEEANRQLVLDFYDRFFNRHETAAADVVVDDYRQHNPEVPDGKAPFVNYFSGYFRDNPQSRAKVIRSAADGDLVWLQVHSTNGSHDRGQAVLDIFRVKNGKIVEHWDIIQAVPEKAANDNTMF